MFILPISINGEIPIQNNSAMQAEEEHGHAKAVDVKAALSHLKIEQNIHDFFGDINSVKFTYYHTHIFPAHWLETLSPPPEFS